MKRVDRQAKSKPVLKSNDSKDSLSDETTQVPETPYRPAAPIACSTQMRSKTTRSNFTPMVRNNNNNIKSLNANKIPFQIPQTPYRTGIPRKTILRRVTPPDDTIRGNSSDELSIIDQYEELNNELKYSEYLRLCMLESKVDTLLSIGVDDIDRELMKLRTRVEEAEDELSKIQMEKEELCRLSVISCDLETLQSNLEDAVNHGGCGSTENVALRNRLKEICDSFALKKVLVPQDASDDSDIVKILHDAGSSISGLNLENDMRGLRDAVANQKKCDEILKDACEQHEKTSGSLEKLSMRAVTACSLDL